MRMKTAPGSAHDREGCRECRFIVQALLCIVTAVLAVGGASPAAAQERGLVAFVPESCRTVLDGSADRAGATQCATDFEAKFREEVNRLAEYGRAVADPQFQRVIEYGETVGALLRALEATPAAPLTLAERALDLPSLGSLEAVVEEVKSENSADIVLTGVVRTGTYFGESGAFPVAEPISDSFSAGKPQSTKSVIAAVTWGSRRFSRSDGKGLHFRIGGEFGYRPTLMLYEEPVETAPAAGGMAGAMTGASAAETPVPTLVARDGNAFAWSFFATPFQVQIKDLMEWAFFAPRIGQTLAVDDTATVKDDEKKKLGKRVSDTRGKAAWQFEVAVARVRLFKQPVRDNSSSTNYLRPTLDTEFGMRWDYRFTNDGALSALRNPERRWFFRFTLDQLQVFMLGKDEPKPFDVGLTVEYERPWRFSSGVPAHTRVLITGNLDLGKIIKDNSKVKRTEGE